MENMEKGLTVPKWVLIIRQKIPQMPQNLSAQKFWISMEKGFIGQAVVRDSSQHNWDSVTRSISGRFAR